MGTHDLKVWLQASGRAKHPWRAGAPASAFCCQPNSMMFSAMPTLACSAHCLQARGADLRGAIERSDLVDIAKKLPPEGGAPAQ